MQVPPLAVLREDFQRRNDGTVMIYGRLHRVTHPITAHGLGSELHPELKIAAK
jgi:hypothetical protein